MPIEVKTPDELQYQFFPVKDFVFTFKVRAAHDAHIALTSSNAESVPMYEIFIGGWNNTKSVIRKNRQKPDVVELNTPGILNAEEFRSFWIRWYDNRIAVGREGETTALMSYELNEEFSVNFVGVCTGWGSSGTWLIDDFTAPISAGPGCWVPSSGGQVPPNAMEAGVDGSEVLYVARARHEGDLIPGKLHPSHGVCYVAWGGGEHGHSEYEVLCSADGYWIPVKDGSLPPNAIPGGEASDGEPLFIGRVTHNNSIIVGKVQPSHGCCYISYAGEELAFKEFEVYAAN